MARQPLAIDSDHLQLREESDRLHRGMFDICDILGLNSFFVVLGLLRAERQRY